MCRSLMCSSVCGVTYTPVPPNVQGEAQTSYSKFFFRKMNFALVYVFLFFHFWFYFFSKFNFPCSSISSCLWIHEHDITLEHFQCGQIPPLCFTSTLGLFFIPLSAIIVFLDISRKFVLQYHLFLDYSCFLFLDISWTSMFSFS